MPTHISPKDTKFKLLILRIYTALIIAGGILTLRSLLSIPKEAGSAILFGLSPERLLMAGGVLLISAVGAGLLLQSWLRPSKFDALRQRLETKIRAEKIWGSVIGLCIIGIISGSSFILQTAEISEPFTQAYFVRLQPLILWVVILSAQTLLALPLLRYGLDLRQLKPKNRIVYSIALVFGFFLILWRWIARSGYGITAIDAGVGWFRLGTPVLETQVSLAWGIAMGLLCAWTWMSENPGKLRWSHFLRKDVVICILLWTAAFSLWMSIPLEANWFAVPPRAPNFEFYPSSDAAVYDISAQNLLLGEGFKTRGSPFAIRPMYALFLAVLHTLGGLSYEPIIWMQVAVLAFLPVFIYGLATLIHNRVSGVLAALLLILREGNAIALGKNIAEAHAKLLMPFLPTTFGVLLFLLVIVAWLQKPKKRQVLLLISGGIIGTFMLIRPEFGVLLPFIGLAALLQLIRRPADWFKGMVLITTGLILMLSPWVWRNYQITGTIFIDSPQYRIGLFAKRYRDEPIGFVIPTPKPVDDSAAIETPVPAQNIVIKPGETTEDYTERIMEGVTEYARDNPGAVTYFIANHFLNSAIQTILYLPTTNRFTNSAIGYLGHQSPDKFWHECCSVENYIRQIPFWHQWDGDLSGPSIIPLTLNLFLIATGISIAWKRQKYIGLMPLLAGIGYYLINALARNSGGRYIIPVDWVGIFYYSIGLMQITLWVIEYFRGDAIKVKIAGGTQTVNEMGHISLLTKPNLVIAACIFILGCVLPITERAIPARYSELSINAQLDALFQPANSNLAEEDIELLMDFIHGNGLVLQGGALYPRYNKPNEMESVWLVHRSRPYPRITFYLSSPHDIGVTLPLQEEPDQFPHASDVLVFGCYQTGKFDALAVIIYSDEGQPEEILWRSPWPDDLVCPLAPVE